MHQPEEPEAFIEFLTEQSLNVVNSCIQRVTVRRTTVHGEYQNRRENSEITGDICKEIQSICIERKLKLMKIYVRNYKVYVYVGNSSRCSLAPLARKHLVQPQNRSGTFTNFEVNPPLTKKRTLEGLVLD